MDNNKITKRFGSCEHLAAPDQCSVPGCKHFDARTSLQKCFGRMPNSVFAAQLYKSDPELYFELRRQAVEANMIPPPIKVRSLQDE